MQATTDPTKEPTDPIEEALKKGHPVEIDLLTADPVLLGKYIGAMRRSKGWSQEQLSEASGSSQSVVSYLELGKKKNKKTGEVRTEGSFLTTYQRCFDALATSATLIIVPDKPAPKPKKSKAATKEREAPAKKNAPKTPSQA